MTRTEICRGVSKRMTSDLAVRADQSGQMPGRGRRRKENISGEARRIRLAGDTICHSQHARYVDTDFPWRATMAVTGEEEAVTREEAGRVGEEESYIDEFGLRRGANWDACVNVARLIDSSLCLRLRQHALRGRRGPKPKAPAQARWVERKQVRPGRSTEVRDPRFSELDALIASEGTRSRTKPELPPRIAQLARVIRVTVHKYRLRHPKWRKEFENQAGSYLYDNRDGQWYDEKLPVYRRRMELAEEKLGERDRSTASATLAFAQFLAEGGRYEIVRHREAAHYFRLAADRWRIAVTSPPMPESFRQYTIEVALKGLEAALRQCL